MTRRDEVLTLLARNPGGLTDAELARLTRASHQTINQVCRRLAAEQLIRRDDLGRPIMNTAVTGSGPPPVGRPPAAAPPPVPPSPAQAAWFWEGNVQAAVIRHLVTRGAAVLSVADTASRARGTDIVATLDGRTLHIEVKGWPSTTYADPRRVGEVKPTHPTVQAKHWFAEAVLAALRLRCRYPDDRVVVAYPDFPRYQRLATETATALRSAHIELWSVDEPGRVTAHAD